jgi:hypothetical protein
MIQGIQLSEFEELTFNVSKLGSSDNVLKAFKELGMRPVFKLKIKNPNKFFRYMIYMYDPKSPFVDLFPDIKERKANCAQGAGYNYNNGFSEGVIEIFEGKNKMANTMIVGFLRMFNSHSWSHLQVLNNQYYKTLENALGNDYSHSAGKNLEQIRTYIKKTESEITKGDTKLIKAVYRIMNYEDLNITVEDYIDLKI